MALVGAVIALIGISATLGSRYQITAAAAVSLEPSVLVDRARSFERTVGTGQDAADRAHGFFTNADIQGWLRTLPDGARRRQANGWPSPLLFWYRSSPRPLVPGDAARLQPGRADPPLTITGMTVVGLDPQGRLLEFAAVGPQIESRADTPAAPVDWTLFFKAAGLDPARFSPVAPDIAPRAFADTRAAWTGTAPDFVDAPLRVEAASHQGTPVSFVIQGPWSRPTRMEVPRFDPTARIASVVTWTIVVPAALLGGIMLVRRNLRLGLGDRRTALTLTIVVFWLELVRRLLGAVHFADAVIEASRAFAMCAQALFAAVVAGTFYLALEPTVRRTRPHLLIAWSRVMSGRVRDPVLGRDVLVGACAGAVLTTITFAQYLMPAALGWPAFQPAPVTLTALDGSLAMAVVVLSSFLDALQLALLGGTGLVLASRVFSRAWIALPIHVVLFSFTAAEGQFETGRLWLNLLLGGLSTALALGVILRFGFVAGVTTFFVHLVSKNTPMTTDPSLFYFPATLSVLLIDGSIAVGGFVLARARQPLLTRG